MATEAAAGGELRLSVDEGEHLLRVAIKSAIECEDYTGFRSLSVRLQERCVEELARRSADDAPNNPSPDHIGALTQVLHLGTALSALRLGRAPLADDVLSRCLRPCARSLTRLDLSGSTALSELGSALCSCPSITWLSCADATSLKSICPPFLKSFGRYAGFLPLLEYLDVRRCPALSRVALSHFPSFARGLTSVGSVTCAKVTLSAHFLSLLEDLDNHCVHHVDLSCRKKLTGTEMELLSKYICRSRRVSTLNLSGSTLDHEGVAFLSEILRNSASLLGLYLKDIGIYYEDCSPLLSALSENRSLRVLQFGCQLINIVEAACLHQHLMCLDINHVALTAENTQAIAGVVTRGLLRRLVLGNTSMAADTGAVIVDALAHPACALEELDLKFNALDCTSACSIAASLSNGSRLTTISLYQNHVSDTGALALAAALKKNPPLRELNLGNNNLGNAGARAVLEALATNTNLVLCHIHSNFVSPNMVDEFELDSEVSIDVRDRVHLSRVVMIVGIAHIWARTSPPIGWSIFPPATLPDLPLWSPSSHDRFPYAVRESVLCLLLLQRGGHLPLTADCVREICGRLEARHPRDLPDVETRYPQIPSSVHGT